MSGPVPAPRVIDAVRAGAAGAEAAGCTYTVLIDAEPAPGRPPRGGERRDAPRRRTRLRSGKVIDERGRHLSDCLVHDLSATGVRLRLPAGLTLPASCQVFDDQSGTLSQGAVSWQRGGEAGLRLTAMADTPRGRVIAADMRRKHGTPPR